MPERPGEHAVLVAPQPLSPAVRLAAARIRLVDGRGVRLLTLRGDWVSAWARSLEPFGPYLVEQNDWGWAVARIRLDLPAARVLRIPPGEQLEPLVRREPVLVARLIAEADIAADHRAAFIAGDPRHVTRWNHSLLETA